MRLTRGPITDARPNREIHSGKSAAATARLPASRAAASRARRGHSSGRSSAQRPLVQRMAAHAHALMTALGDSAAAGSSARPAQAASSSAEDAVVSRPSARPAVRAASMSHARTHGGSAPAANV